jgi:hypothetical protein
MIDLRIQQAELEVQIQALKPAFFDACQQTADQLEKNVPLSIANSLLASGIIPVTSSSRHNNSNSLNKIFGKTMNPQQAGRSLGRSDY